MAKTKDEGGSRGTFASILADGKIHITVPEGTEGSVVREYTTSDEPDVKRKKTEMVYKDISGLIKEVKFEEGKFGNQILLSILDEEEGEEDPTILCLGTESNFGEDVMKKLLNVNLKKPVKFAPYSFKDGKGKTQRGVVMMQSDKKLENFFYDSKEKKNLHGYPETLKPKSGKSITKAQWRKYFSECSEWLVEYLTPKFESAIDKEWREWGTK